MTYASKSYGSPWYRQRCTTCGRQVELVRGFCSEECREAARTYRLLYVYGMTPETYEKMSEDQSGLCAICRSEPGARRLAIDHDHRTKRIRGRLCSRCNVVLGMVRDQPSLLRAMAEYLECEDAPYGYAIPGSGMGEKEILKTIVASKG